MIRGFFKKASQFLPVFFDQGAAGVPIFRLVTVTGATQAITFEQLDVPDMPDTDYVAMVTIEGAGTVYVDESTKTTTGFSIINTGGSGVANLVIGYAGRP